MVYDCMRIDCVWCIRVCVYCLNDNIEMEMVYGDAWSMFLFFFVYGRMYPVSVWICVLDMPCGWHSGRFLYQFIRFRVSVVMSFGIFSTTNKQFHFNVPNKNYQINRTHSLPYEIHTYTSLMFCIKKKKPNVFFPFDANSWHNQT